MISIAVDLGFSIKKMSPKNLSPGFWNKGIAKASKLRQIDARQTALDHPNIIDSYIACFISTEPRSGGIKRTILRLSRNCGVKDYSTSLSEWRKGNARIAEVAIREMLPHAILWALTVRNFDASEADASWIAERVFPCLLVDGVGVGRVLKAALTERLPGISINTNVFNWLVCSLLPTAMFDARAHHGF